LFYYLGNPERVRLHIGATRMPDFFLDERERLALTLFLVQQKSPDRPLPQFPAELFEQTRPHNLDAKRILIEELKCTACHKLNGQGGAIAADLATVGKRSKLQWLKLYLALPQAFDAHSSMPAQAYSLNGKRLTQAIPGAAEKIISMAEFLAAQAKQELNEMETEFGRVRIKNKDVTAKMGESVFRALNCAACHTLGTMQARKTGPDLRFENSRVQSDWLRMYLAKPKAIRPFGFQPGTGSRMPDFRLSPAEIDTIFVFFSHQPSQPLDNFEPVALTRFTSEKVKKLIRDKLSCLGCHQLNGEGGRIAPDLSSVGKRLKPDYLAAMVKDPQHVAPQSIMPRIQLNDQLFRLVSSFLSVQKSDAPAAYLSLTTYRSFDPSLGNEAAQLYGRYCSPCHGAEGRGDGFNSRFLPVKPADHSSKVYMSTRPDDTIFDGIHGGGSILGKSNRMPPFGETLTREQIWSLVRYLRALCDCQGPDWSASSGKN